MKTFCEYTVTDEMIRAGSAVLTRLLGAYDVDGSWSDDDVLPDVFRAMVLAAPEDPMASEVPCSP